MMGRKIRLAGFEKSVARTVDPSIDPTAKMKLKINRLTNVSFIT